jgi:hypothetical protein
LALAAAEIKLTSLVPKKEMFLPAGIFFLKGETNYSKKGQMPAQDVHQGGEK